ncbi:FixH family protein [Henriciella sp. AS95]|uniref:FixH family protein n=1 Tax=Henriciella sp. AS95 TaxID=3135782 RepID=UPI00316BC012
MSVAQQYRQGPDAKLKGWHVLLIMMAFFGLMFAVNGVFLYSAITSFPGEDVEKSYLQGLNYNDTLEAKREQAELGWTMRAGLADRSNETLRVEVNNKDGLPVSRLSVLAQFRRNATTSGDTTLPMEAVADEPGVYEVALPSLERGDWSIIVTAMSDVNDDRFVAEKEIRLK